MLSWLPLTLLVFSSDLSIAYVSAKVWSTVAAKQFWPAIGWNVALDLAIGINMLGFATLSWPMLVPSCLGGAVGLALAMKQDSA